MASYKQRSQSEIEQLINDAISDGQLSLEDVQRLEEKKAVPLSSIFGLSAKSGAQLVGGVGNQYNIKRNDNGSYSWTPNQANYAPLYHPGSVQAEDEGKFISPGQGSGWVMSGETKGKYDKSPQKTYTYYGDPSYLNKEKESDSGKGGETPATPGVQPADANGALKKSFNLADYMAKVNGGTSAEEEDFVADTTPTLYDNWVKRQPAGSPLEQAGGPGAGGSDATSTRRWDRNRAGDGSYRFAASQKFRDELNSRLGTG